MVSNDQTKSSLYAAVCFPISSKHHKDLAFLMLLPEAKMCSRDASVRRGMPGSF